MKRKIIKQGHNTLTITLPSEWIKKYNLNPGDEVDVHDNSGTLVINGRQNNVFKSTTIDITGLSMPMIWRFFQGAYREGFDEIKIIYDTEQKHYEGAYNYYASQFSYSQLGEIPQKNFTALDMINQIVSRFIGIAIIDNGNGYCIIREMGELSNKEFDASFRRIFLLIIEVFDKTIHFIKTNQRGSIDVCKTLHAMDINIDRFIDYCCRINNKVNHIGFNKNKPLIFSALFLLELVGDEFKYIGTHLSHSKKKIDEKDLIAFAEAVKKHFEMYYHLFYKFNKEDVIKFGENDLKIYSDHFKWTASTKEVQSIRRHLMQISKFVFCLMEIRIEMEY